MLEYGDIIVVKSPTIIGKIIRWVTQSWASHVCVYIANGWVFEARPGGSKAIEFSHYQKKGYEIHIYRFIAPDITINNFVKILLTKKNMAYDYGQVFGLLIWSLFKINIKAQNHKLAICSEIVFDAANEAGLPLPHISKELITPGDYERWPFLKRIA